MIKREDVSFIETKVWEFFWDLSDPQVDRKRKQIIELFKKSELFNTVEKNIKTVDFLDVFFDLTIGPFKQHRKPNDSPAYIHLNSNHLWYIVNQLPKSISKSILIISSNK